ncbi:hypothetical protein CIK06_07390 [Plantactinospora sp. KBS50]|nr:hypothetical protein CIK06_07390 [Plantactinospora sp. KBS50]
MIKVLETRNDTDSVHDVLSFNHEETSNAIAHQAVVRGLDPSHLECSRCDHFQLIEPNHLRERLEGIL